MTERGTLKLASPIAFDTLAFANKLKAAGIDPKAAEAQSEATAEVLGDLVSSQLATKSDVGEIKKEIELLNWKLNWLITLIGVIGTILAIVNILHLFHW